MKGKGKIINEKACKNHQIRQILNKKKIFSAIFKSTKITNVTNHIMIIIRKIIMSMMMMMMKIMSVIDK